MPAPAAVRSVLMADAPFLPTKIANLQLWLAADRLALADGAAVATWPDSSGQAHTATQATGVSQPAYAAAVASLNNKPAVNFSGSKFMTLGDLTSTFSTAGALFLVYSLNGTQNEYAAYATAATSPDYWRYPGDGNGYFQVLNSTRTNAVPVAMPNTGAHIMTVNSAAGRQDFWLDGASKSGFSGGAFDGGNAHTVGKSGDGARFLGGWIAEVILYARIPTTTEQRRVEAYLAAKYAIAVAS